MSQRAWSTHYAPVSGTEGNCSSLPVSTDSVKTARNDLVAEHAHNRRSTQYGRRTQTTPKKTDSTVESRDSWQAYYKNNCLECKTNGIWCLIKHTFLSINSPEDSTFSWYSEVSFKDTSSQRKKEWCDMGHECTIYLCWHTSINFITVKSPHNSTIYSNELNVIGTKPATITLFALCSLCHL